MAQALFQAAQQYKKVHGNWPAISTTAIPSYKVTQTGKTTTGHTFKELPPIVFDWAHLLDNYARRYATPTEEEIAAVAMLMTYCGRALHMEYGYDSSDAAFVYMPFRMAAYFGIQPYVKNMDRQYYSTEKWEELIYNELSNGRAVPYTGVSGPTTNDPGHAFVLDGYKDGLWHINWGWGQGAAVAGTVYNGYFSLSYLMPNGEGPVSGGALGSEYKYLQQATIGVSFDAVEGGVANTCYTHIGGSRGYSSLTTEVKYLNYNVEGGVFTLDGAWAIDNGNGNYTILKKDYEGRLFNRRTTDDYGEYGDLATYTQRINQLPVSGITDGTYTVLHVSSLAGENNWVADDCTDHMNFTVTVSNGSISDVVCHPIEFSKSNLTVTNIEFIGDMEAYEENTVKVTINNTGDDFWGNLAMYYNTSTTPATTKKYEHLAAIKPGVTTHEFTVNLPKGEYNLWFIANGESASANNAFGTGKMFIGYGADANKVQEGKLEFDGQEGATTLSVKSVNGQLAPVAGTFEVVNNSTNLYTNTYYIAVEKGNTKYATASVPVEVAANSTETIHFDLGTVTGLVSGSTYTIRLFKKNGDAQVNIATKDLALQPYFRYWKVDGTMVEAREGYYDSNNWKTVYAPDAQGKAEAVAIDLRGISTTYMQEATNPNCIYYMTASQKPSYSSSTFGKTNNVIDGVAETMNINANYGFYAPEAFEAKEITFKRTFTKGNNENGEGWETIILPFEVNSVKQGTKNLKWFKSANDKRCHFWLMELTGAIADALTFDYATAFEANKPYILSVPGNKWGDNWNLAGKEITFTGKNVNVPVTALQPIVYSNREFTGTFSKITANGYILNADGTKFVNGSGEVKPYNAYIKADETVNALRIVIEGEEATGIEAVDNSQLTTGNEPIFNLNGQRLVQKQCGVNIVGGRKIVVK